MFDSLTDKLNLIFKRLAGKGRLDERDVDNALREVRVALLEADVHFKVARDFVDGVRARAVGQEVLGSLTPAQQVVKIVYEELCSLMGGEAAELNLKGSPPLVFMLVGLQGSGKTTTAAKLARHLKSKGRQGLLVCADVRRPAAYIQLELLGQQAGAPVFPEGDGQDSVFYCRQAVGHARMHGLSALLLDTAGRLALDNELMEELRDLKAALSPRQVLLVADGMTGQDAVNLGKVFDSGLGIDGVILTKMDGDARGGAALSLKAVTGKPILFLGVGEKLDGLEPFHPERMARRILGMGDVLTLAEKAQAAYDEKQAEELEKKFRKAAFTLEDFRDQVRQIKKMGSLEELLSMIPGIGKVVKAQGLKADEGQLIVVEAIINSMTRKERANPTILNGSRRLRIARGSGTIVSQVNQVVKRFLEMKKMMKRMSRGGKLYL